MAPSQDLVPGIHNRISINNSKWRQANPRDPKDGVYVGITDGRGHSTYDMGLLRQVLEENRKWMFRAHEGDSKVRRSLWVV